MTRRSALIALALFLALSLLGTAARAQSSVMVFNETVTVDALGNATVKLEMQLTAKQYANWKQRYGLNPSLLKRDIGKSLTQYETYDFQVEQRDMKREIEVSLKAKGFARYLGDGQFELVAPRDWQGGERHGSVYEYHYPEQLDGGEIAQHNVKVHLPETASLFSEQAAENGETKVRYTLPVQAAGSGLLMGAGASGLMAIGCAVVAFVPTGPRRRRADRPADRPAKDDRNAPADEKSQPGRPAWAGREHRAWWRERTEADTRCDPPTRGLGDPISVFVEA